MLSSADQLFKDVDFIFQQDLAPYFPEGQQFTKNVFFLLVLWSILIWWDSELVGFLFC